MRHSKLQKKKSYQDSVITFIFFNQTFTQNHAGTYYLGRMRATGQLKEAPVSKGFFERYKKKSKKAKKGVKIEAKKEGDKQLKQLKFLVGKKD